MTTIEPYEAVSLAQKLTLDYAYGLWIAEGTIIYFDDPGTIRIEGVSILDEPTSQIEKYYREMLTTLVPDRPFTYESTVFGGWRTLVVHQFGSVDDFFYATIAVDKEGNGIISVENDNISTSQSVDFTKNEDDYLWQCLNPAEAVIGQSADGDMEMRLFVEFIQPHLPPVNEVNDLAYDVYQDSFGDTR